MANLEKELFEMVYQWGRVGIKVDYWAPAYQKLLGTLVEEKYKKELEIADNRWKEAGRRLKK